METLGYDKNKMDMILKQMLGDEFIDSFAVDLPKLAQIQIFIKTTDEFIWCDRFLGRDKASEHLGGLGYTDISVIAAKDIKGEWIL